MLPSAIQVLVHTLGGPGTVEVDRGEASKSGNPFFRGKAKGLVLPGDTIQEALAGTKAFYGDLELNMGEVHLADPSVYRKGHKKEGQVIPGSGGWTVTHSASIVLEDDGRKRRFTLLVTFIQKDDGVELRVSALLQSSANTARTSGLEFATA